MALELWVVAGDKPRSITAPSTFFTVGSNAQCDVRFPSDAVHEQHAEFRQDLSGQWTVRPMSSQAVVLVNWVETRESTISPGDKLCLGKVEIEVRGEEITFETAIRSQTERVDKPLPIGTIVCGRYRVESRIATGGMGEVYRAQHVELEQPLALKIMRNEFSNDAEFAQRFKREAISSTRIGHEHIVSVIDFGKTDDGRLFSVMEFLEGDTLSALIKENGVLPEWRARKIAAQAADALSAAHAQGIIHRDLKPDNVMILQKPGRPDFVKVLDFGVAKITDGVKSSGDTSMGFIVGTPQYMSPEQSAGLAVDGRTDIYSLGLILYEMLNGRPAFQGQTPAISMAMQMMEPPPPFGPHPRSGEIENLVLRMLAKQPEMRPQTMQLVRGELLGESLSTSPLSGQSGAQEAIETVPLPRPSLGDPLPNTRAAGPLSLSAHQTIDDEGDGTGLPKPVTDKMMTAVVDVGELASAEVRSVRGRRLWPWVLLLLMAGFCAALWFFEPTLSGIVFPGDTPSSTPKAERLDKVPAVPEVTPVPPQVAAVAASEALDAGPKAAASDKPESTESAGLAENPESAEKPVAASKAPPTETKVPTETKGVTPSALSKPKPERPSKKAARTPEGDQVIVRVVSRPEGALVKRQGKVLGKAPLSINRPQGSRLSITVSLEGFAPQQAELKFSADKSVEFDLKPLKKDTKRVELHDNPFEEGEPLKVP
jgi:serine/threonine protein kinase